MKSLIKNIIDLSYKNKEGHIGSSLSILDLLYVLYKNFINYDNKFVLSKGHASLGLYVVLDHFKLLNCDINTFCKFNSELGGHPSNKIENIECSTGSLGHGFPFALGLAMSKKIQKQSGKIFTIIGDGEANEGTVWETALLGSHQKLNNLCCILDHNHSTDRALNIGNMIDKFKSFGWYCSEIDGHNHDEIYNACLLTTSESPHFILANTIKGKGCSMTKNNPEWHHKSPNDEEYKKIILEIESNI